MDIGDAMEFFDKHASGYFNTSVLFSKALFGRLDDDALRGFLSFGTDLWRFVVVNVCVGAALGSLGPLKHKASRVET
jgi:hypothetical protein